MLSSFSPPPLRVLRLQGESGIRGLDFDRAALSRSIARLAPQLKDLRLPLPPALPSSLHRWEFETALMQVVHLVKLVISPYPLRFDNFPSLFRPLINLRKLKFLDVTPQQDNMALPAQQVVDYLSQAARLKSVRLPPLIFRTVWSQHERDTVKAVAESVDVVGESDRPRAQLG